MSARTGVTGQMKDENKAQGETDMQAAQNTTKPITTKAATRANANGRAGRRSVTRGVANILTGLRALALFMLLACAGNAWAGTTLITLSLIHI